MLYLREFWRDESGQELTEYALLVALLACASTALLSSAGTTVRALWSAIDNCLTNMVAAAS